MKPRPFRVSDCRPGLPEPECPCQCSCWRITLAAQPKRAQRAVALTLFDEEELS